MLDLDEQSKSYTRSAICSFRRRCLRLLPQNSAQDRAPAAKARNPPKSTPNTLRPNPAHFLAGCAYCRVDMCRRSWQRPGQRNSDPIINGSYIQRTSDFRVPSVISNLTGFCVLLWVIDVRSFTCPATKTSATFSLTRSQPRNLLSMARMNSAASGAIMSSSTIPVLARIIQ